MSTPREGGPSAVCWRDTAWGILLSSCYPFPERCRNSKHTRSEDRMVTGSHSHTGLFHPEGSRTKREPPDHLSIYGGSWMELGAQEPVCCLVAEFGLVVDTSGAFVFSSGRCE